MIFVDTSALYALLDRDDLAHERARIAWIDWLSGRRPPRLVTGNYILMESCALVQARLGMEALRVLIDDLLPVIVLEWVTPADHQAAMQALLTAERRRLSLVDCVSFQLMRRIGINRAFTFDAHFAEMGFEALPG